MIPDNRDIEFMNRVTLKKEIVKLRAAIVAYIKATKHDMCKINRQLLAAAVPGLDDFDPTLPGEEEFIAGCRVYWHTCAANGARILPEISVRPNFTVIDLAKQEDSHGESNFAKYGQGEDSGGESHPT